MDRTMHLLCLLHYSWILHCWDIKEAHDIVVKFNSTLSSIPSANVSNPTSAVLTLWKVDFLPNWKDTAGVDGFPLVFPCSLSSSFSSHKWCYFSSHSLTFFLLSAPPCSYFLFSFSFPSSSFPSLSSSSSFPEFFLSTVPMSLYTFQFLGGGKGHTSEV